MSTNIKKGFTLNDKISAAGLIVAIIGMILGGCVTYGLFIKNDAVYEEQISNLKSITNTQQKAINYLTVNAAKMSEQKLATMDALRMVTEAINGLSKSNNSMAIGMARVETGLKGVEHRLTGVEKRLDSINNEREKSGS